MARRLLATVGISGVIFLIVSVLFIDYFFDEPFDILFLQFNLVVIYVQMLRRFAAEFVVNPATEKVD